MEVIGDRVTIVPIIAGEEALLIAVALTNTSTNHYTTGDIVSGYKRVNYQIGATLNS